MNSENFKIVGVTRNIVTIEILDSTQFTGQFNIGSYIKIPYQCDSENYIIGIIKNYRIKNIDSPIPESTISQPNFVIEVELIGSYKKYDNKYLFERGAHGIPLPPNNGIEILNDDDYCNIYSCKIEDKEMFTFSNLIQDENIRVPVNGNKFFNKHFAIVGSTGSGKSHTVATVLQQAIKEKNVGYDGLNNSHIVIFDIHGEYVKAFPIANHINSNNIKIPYWLFDSDELSDLFIESNEQNSHNQVSQFRYAVTENKKKEDLLNKAESKTPQDRIYFDTPLKFNIDEIINYIKNMNNELINKKKNRIPTSKTGEEILNRIPKYFEQVIEFDKINSDLVNGPFTGDFERFILRLETIRNNPRLKFLFDDAYTLSLEDILKQFLGYNSNNSNVTVIDLSGIPFEVLSITVSLISRILFEFGYYYKKILAENIDCETPLLLVYEEAHKYVPRSELVKYRASKNAIERIAKEGRKYGVTLGIVSQRPSEISETIFSQCNNFIAMRLTNPDDQNYVKRLLPDSLGDLTDYLPTLQAGEALLIGESIIIPSLVKIDFPVNEPKSTDIKYLDLWKEQWKNVNFENITKEWKK
ncbi:MAG: ATP-binding protein [Spirochaetes bacterium]|nr:ATP-binding protein [Spirochaetota bacterium]